MLFIEASFLPQIAQDQNIKLCFDSPSRARPSGSIATEKGDGIKPLLKPNIGSAHSIQIRYVVLCRGSHQDFLNQGSQSSHVWSFFLSLLTRRSRHWLSALQHKVSRSSMILSFTKNCWLTPLTISYSRSVMSICCNNKLWEGKLPRRQDNSRWSQGRYHANQGCHHSRAATTIAQHSSSPYLSSTKDSGRSVWR